MVSFVAAFLFAAAYATGDIAFEVRACCRQVRAAISGEPCWQYDMCKCALRCAGRRVVVHLLGRESLREPAARGNPGFVGRLWILVLGWRP